MTEAEWLASRDVESMIADLIRQRYPGAEPCDWKVGERKKRLFISACLRRIWDLLPVEYRELTEAIEQFADGSTCDIAHQWRAAESAQGGHADLLFSLEYDDVGLLCFYCTAISAGENKALRNRETNQQAALFRDIFGNPFRPVLDDFRWHTSSAHSLATAMYDSRDFVAMPILADALEEAGCDNPDVLAHCRGDGPHVRGCWVVDLILGKK
jgi:hypothetical protein